MPHQFTLWVQWSVKTKCLAVLTSREQDQSAGDQSKPRQTLHDGTRKCSCQPIYAMGFYEERLTTSRPKTPDIRTTPTLFLTQFCVHPDHRQGGLLHFLGYEIERSQLDRELIVFWSMYSTKLKPMFVSKRFVAKLTENARHAPKTDAMFQEEHTPRALSGLTQKYSLLSLKEPAILCPKLKAVEEDKIADIINQFTSKWKYSNYLRKEDLKLMNGEQFGNLFKVVPIYDEIDITATGNKELKGVFCLKILAMRTCGTVMRTALLSHIAWNTSLGDMLTRQLLDVILKTALESQCDALIVNDCFALGDALEEDERFVNMDRVGVGNHVYVKGIDNMKSDEFGMTMFG